MNDILIINGPCGVGKTTAACAVSDLMRAASLPNQHIDFDSLAQIFPRPAGDLYAIYLGANALAAALRVDDDLGPRPLILPMVVETQDELDFLHKTLNRQIIHTRLTAPQIVRRARLAKRETGDWYDRLSKRSDELTEILDAAALDGRVVDTTDKSPEMVAKELLDATGWAQHKGT